MLYLDMSPEEFAAKRRGAQDRLIERLQPIIKEALSHLDNGEEDWSDPIKAELESVYESEYKAEGGEGEANATSFVRRVNGALEKAKPTSDAQTMAVALAIATINAAAMQAAQDDPEELFMEWVTMHDEDVRPEHRVTDGQVRPLGEPFDVDGVEMLMPGDVRAPIELWINCRCTLRPHLATEFASSKSLTAGGSMDGESIPWHGVWAPEGVWSGDKRKFAEGSLSHRPLPLPLTWQKIGDEGHKGHVVVALADDLRMIDGLMHASGHFISNAEADEVIGLLGEFGRFGVSVDADASTFELDEEEGGVVFTEARVCSACIVPIPAFAEAWVSLGKAPWMQDEETEEGEPVDGEALPAEHDPAADEPGAVRDDAPPPPEKDDDEDEDRKKVAASSEFRDVSTEERDRLKGEGKALPDGSFPIANRDDLANAIQAIGRAKDPAKAKAHIKKRARALGAEDMIPEGWAVIDQMRERASVNWTDIEQFVDVAPGRTEDGPGWLTHPVDTDRLRDYWVRGPGAAKIGWGSPGDFNRCRMQVAKYIKPQHLNGYCANRHYDALGFWPGRPVSGETTPFTEVNTQELSEEAKAVALTASAAPAITLVAAAGSIKAPASCFANPNLTEPTPVTITEEGRVFGHIATWDSCHVAYQDFCVAPPRSSSDYSYFLSGAVPLDNGEMMPVGHITIGGGHADGNLGMRAALEHYDSTSAVAADVTVGEDEVGIWFSGWLRPGITDEMVYALQASALSGDWRSRSGFSQDDLELIAALAVNVPGFGIPRVRIAASSKGQVSLVAAGVVPPSHETVAAAPEVDVDALAEAIFSRIIQVQQNKERMAALAARVNQEV